MEQNKKSAGQFINEKKFLILEIIIVALITAYMLRGTYPSLILCLYVLIQLAVTGLDIYLAIQDKFLLDMQASMPLEHIPPASCP